MHIPTSYTFSIYPMKSMNLKNLLLFLLLIGFLSCSAPKEEKSTSIESPITQEEAEQKKLILFFGNSLTAGYGIEEEDAFPGLVATKIDSLNLEYRVVNAGLSGETTASGLSRLDWFLEEEPAIFILELGANDGLRGISLDETKKNLKAMIQKVRERFPDTVIILAGMQIPPNMGQAYTATFEKMYPEVAKEEKVHLIPFLLEGVAGDAELNLPDGIHPTEAGHQIVFKTIWPHLENYL
ncbi:arylesterase [Cecembia lonarensis]|uniref:Esterase TesA n=1 Tax=Cecembia lonarensis (strain CCUG 58316 / KCTC 22772 / LW9) TaxID=1225176 RepID=K1LKT4_CECL9|nr:arylesterase [Cecembia lonarensis]EKB51003.1 Esterase TesA precursor [Cecembia lonarensis LW9]